MRKILFGILTTLSVLFNVILVSSIDRLDTELRVVTLLYNTNQEILNEYFVEQQIDSMYLDYGVYYQKKYYEKEFK